MCRIEYARSCCASPSASSRTLRRGASALRFYEDVGLIASERTAGNQRRYARATLRRVAFIRAAQRVGLTLEEIKEALATLPEGRTPTKADWAAALADLATAASTRQIERLERLRDKLDGCIGCGCLSLRTCALQNPDDEGAGPRGRGDGLPGSRDVHATESARPWIGPWRCGSSRPSPTRRWSPCPGTCSLEEWGDDVVVPLPRGISRHIVRIVRLRPGRVRRQADPRADGRSGSTACCATCAASGSPPSSRSAWSAAARRRTARRSSRPW